MLRIEDTDQERLVEGGMENFIRSLRWAGISIDEGVDLSTDGKVIQKGSLGPYIQSERLPIYQKYANQLLAQGQAYYCFCAKERLEELRKFQELNKLPTGYDSRCREIPAAEASERRAAGESAVVRLKMPASGETTFTDLIRGEVAFQNSLIDDQVIVKSDGFPTYHLAAVVDDHLMEVTHVIRGEEWLPSTPKHIALYRMLDWKEPAFAHLSLLINEQKQKLSKRHGDVSVEDFQAKGYLAEALVNFIAFLGWNPGDERELFTLGELEREFSLEKVSKAAAVFNREKLNWYNRQYMMSLDLNELTRRAVPFFKHAGVLHKTGTDEPAELASLKNVVALERQRSATLAELAEATGFMFADELAYEPELLVWKKSTKKETETKLEALSEFLLTLAEFEWTAEKLDAAVQGWIKKNGYGVGDVLWPMRVALSGQKNSPGPYEIAAVLGKKKTLERLSTARKKLA